MLAIRILNAMIIVQVGSLNDITKPIPYVPFLKEDGTPKDDMICIFSQGMHV